jgi:Holliday junction resolvasome RuvABC endonuclease subunit
MRSFDLEKRKRLFADALNVAMCHCVSELEEDEDEYKNNELRRI